MDRINVAVQPVNGSGGNVLSLTFSLRYDNDSEMSWIVWEKTGNCDTKAYSGEPHNASVNQTWQ